MTQQRDVCTLQPTDHGESKRRPTVMLYLPTLHFRGLPGCYFAFTLARELERNTCNTTIGTRRTQPPSGPGHSSAYHCPS